MIDSGRESLPRALLATSVIRCCPAACQHAGENAGRCIERKPRGQRLDRELHRPLAGGGDAVEERTARPAAVDLWAVDSRLGPRCGGEDHGLLRGRGDQPRPLSGDLDLRGSPIRVIALGTVAGVRRDEDQRDHAGHRQVHALSRVSTSHDRAFPDFLPVGDHAEANAAFASPRVVVHSADRAESRRAPAEIDDQYAPGMRAHSAGETLPGDGHRLLGHGPIRLCLAPTLGNLAQVQAGKRNDSHRLAARRRLDQEAGENHPGEDQHQIAFRRTLVDHRDFLSA